MDLVMCATAIDGWPPGGKGTRHHDNNAIVAPPTFVKGAKSAAASLPIDFSRTAPPKLANPLDQKIAEAVAERDAFWRKQERVQLEFVREETEKLMGKMHGEMERLHMANRELERRLFVEEKPMPSPLVPSEELERCRRELSAERYSCAELRRELGLAVKRSAGLAQMLERSGKLHREQVGQLEANIADLHAQIRRLNGLLLAKSKSRSIGPTMARLGCARRSQSGDSSRIRSQSEGGEWTLDGNQPQRGIGATAAKVGADSRGRLPLRLVMAAHSGKGKKQQKEEEEGKGCA